MQHVVNQSREKQKVSMSTRSRQINVNVLAERCWRGVTSCVCVRVYVHTVSVHVCVYIHVCVYVRVCVHEKVIQETHQLAEIHQLTLITPLAYTKSQCYN